MKDSQAVLEQSDKKNDGSNAVRPACAPNRVPQEHEFSATIQNAQAVWSKATKKRGGSFCPASSCSILIVTPLVSTQL
jgi:hypothetical protein